MKHKIFFHTSIILAIISPVSSSALASEMTTREVANVSTFAADDEITDTVSMNNTYADTTVRQLSYGSESSISLRIYNTVDNNMRLPRAYIVLPKGMTAINGLTGVKKALKKYEQQRDIKGKLVIKQLPDSVEGREVYEIVPDKGTYVLKGGSWPSAVLPVKITKKHLPNNQIVMNANSDAEVSDDVVFFGAGNGQDVQFDATARRYPPVSINTVGIKSKDDSVVRGIVYNNIKRTINLDSPQIEDTYKIVNASDDNQVLKTLTKQGELDTSYSRKDLVGSLEVLQLDAKKYDEKSLTINEGKLTGDSSFDTQETVITGSDKVYSGNTYTVSVKEFGQDVTINYVDKNHKKIHQSKTLSGDVGDKYDTTTSPYQLDIDGYELDTKQIPDNAKGIFGREEVSVTYQYKQSSKDKKKDKSKQRKEKQKKQAKKETKNSKRNKNNEYIVVIRHVDQDGNLVAKDEVLKGEKGEQYYRQVKNVKGYTINNDSRIVNGKFGEDQFKNDGIFSQNEKTTK